MEYELLRKIRGSYIREIDNKPCFVETEAMREEARLWVTGCLADNCEAYTLDDEDEIYMDGVITCYNCRYRRWMAGGFSCLKLFPCKFN